MEATNLTSRTARPKRRSWFVRTTNCEEGVGMRFAWVAVGVILLAVGVVWIFQGVGSRRGSFMTGDPVWAWIGVGAVALSVPMLVRGIRR